MNKVMKKYSILLLLTLFVAACGGGDDDGDVITPSNERIEVDTRDLTLSGDGQEVIAFLEVFERDLVKGDVLKKGNGLLGREIL